MKVTGQRCGKETYASIKIKRVLAGLPVSHNLYEFVRKVPVSLEERARTHAILAGERLINKVWISNRDEAFLLFVSIFALRSVAVSKDGDSRGLGHSSLQILDPSTQLRPVSVRRACDLHEKLSVVGVGEKLNFPNRSRNVSCPANLPKGCDRTVDQWRTDGALFNAEDLVRSQLEISRDELWSMANLQT